MEEETVRQWLDRYQEKLRTLINEGCGCTYVEDITCACGICFEKAEKYSVDEGVLFSEEDFNIVSTNIVDCVKDVLENKLENGNRIQFVILHGGSVMGGFGVWVVKEHSEFIDKLLDSKNAYLVALLIK